MRKRYSFSGFLMLSTALALGISRGVNKPVKAEAISEINAQIHTVQVRSGGPGANYLVINDSNIEQTGSVITFDGSSYNAPEYVKVRLSPTGEDISLSAFIDSTKQWTLNLWLSGGVMFPISDENYETYNGTTIYSIEVLKGCTYLDNNFNKVTVPETVKYINGDYGRPSAKNEAFQFAPAAKPLENLGEIEISGVHNRMDHDSGYRWIMLTFSEEIFNVYLDVSTWMLEVNLLDNILIYFSEDGTPVTLRTIYEPATTGVTLQLFGTKTLLGISISNEIVNEKYRYAGPEMYKVTIKENTQIPNQEDGVDGYRLISKEISFINNDYQKYGEIPGVFDDEHNPRIYEEWSINFVVEVAGLENLGDIGISVVHNRMDHDSGYRWFMLFLDSPIYEVSLNVSDWMQDLNLLDNIKIYLSEDAEPFTLRQIYDPTTTGVTLQLFGNKNMLAISISNEKEGEQYKYCGPNMYKVLIEEGAQIPTFEKGVAGYRVIASKTVLINDEYHMYGETDEMGDDGNPRLFEEWNIHWSVASCYVTFKVEGIEGLSYPDMLLDYGQRVSLDKFNVDGYDLKVTTKDGDTIYKNIIGSNHNLEVILTYSKASTNEKENKPSVGGIIAISAASSTLLLSGAALFIFRKKIFKRKGVTHE